jgi:hypothetical protein|tara:strand:+ start:1088 stop:1633 length:546 start_codon:yes stop_codon:yes gene_type:complete
MSKTIVKKKDLQKLISESIRRGKQVTTNTTRINFTSLNENINKVHNKIRIAIVKEGISNLNIRNYKPILKEESFYGSGSNRHNPGESAANGIEEVIKGLRKAYDMVTDKATGHMIMNSITRLSNTLAVIGTYVGSGQSQTEVNPERLYKALKPIPYPAVEAAEEGDEKAAERMKKSYMDGF